jgi:hypothetical protein
VAFLATSCGFKVSRKMVLPGPINLLVRQRSPGHVTALSIRIEWSSVLYFAGQPKLHVKYEVCISEVEIGGIRAPRSNSAELPKPSGFGTVIPLCEKRYDSFGCFFANGNLVGMKVLFKRSMCLYVLSQPDEVHWGRGLKSKIVNPS